MCIIVIKPIGAKMPTKAIIKNCWTNNPDGAGFMYSKDGAVHISKGFMNLNALTTALNALDGTFNIPMVLHFRIGTHGANNAANTHPFPISDKVADLRALSLDAPLALVHNGIISGLGSSYADLKISDTMEFILSRVSQLYKLNKNFYTKAAGRDIVYNMSLSKFCFLDARARMYTVGDFTKDKASGLYYSNHSYQKQEFTYLLNDTRLKRGTYNYAAPYAREMDVMPLADGDYLIKNNGAVVDGDGHFLAPYGTVYKENDKGLIYYAGGSVFNAQNLPLKYDSTKAIKKSMASYYGNDLDDYAAD